MPKAKSALAAIEKHERLDRKFFKVCAAQDSALANQRDVDRAGDAAERAAWRMARTVPTTIAGAAALAAYITCAPATGLFTLGETEWHETAFKTLALALAEIARQAA